MTNNFLQLNSKFCLTPSQCYEVKTDLPLWFVLLLAGSSLFLIKEIYNTINS
jgi:hypothetical protein